MTFCRNTMRFGPGLSALLMLVWSGPALSRADGSTQVSYGGTRTMTVADSSAIRLVPRLGDPRLTRRVPAPLSAAGEELFLEIWDHGGLRGNPLAPQMLERRLLRKAESASAAAPPTPPAFGLGSVATSLAPDAVANDTTLRCGNPPRPPNEAEPSIAAWGPYVLTSYNDGSSRCLGSGTWGSQGHAYSVDYGATFTDGGVLAGPTPNDVFHCDPTVAVNPKTGAFYISGLLRQGPLVIDGVVALKGHFADGGFIIDVRRNIALAQGDDFLDKPWMTADSVSGNVYITWTNFRADGTSHIEMQRCDADLNPLGPLQAIYVESGIEYSVQGTYPTVGPDGELYVPWTRYQLPFSGNLAAIQVVQSHDFGMSFQPVQTIARFDLDCFSGGPGSRRTFGSSNVAMAVDASRGPHRGRAYIVWDESLPYQDAPFSPAVVASDGPTDDFFSSATPFVPGGRIRGTVGGTDRDIFTFTGRRGDTFVLRTDTLTSYGGCGTRILCPTDTASIATWHTLAVGSAGGLGLLCGLPHDGTYYLIVGPIDAGEAARGTYVFSTAFVSPTPGAVARDNREQVLSYSDDGITWSPRVRLNDSAPGVAGCFPSVVVDGLGRVHCIWLDWRADPGCGDISDTYLTSSGDGGVSWSENRRVTDVSSYWGWLASRSEANQGDYIQVAADGDRVYACFADSRMDNPDILVDASIHRSVATCPADLSVTAGGDTTVQMALTNGGNFETPLAWRVSESAGWLTGVNPEVSGSQSLTANGGTAVIEAALHPPLASAGDSSWVLFVTTDPFIPGHEDTCRTLVHSVAPSCIQAEVQLEPRALNPRSMGRWVSCTVEPQSPYRPGDIEIASIRLAGGGGSVTPDLEAPVTIEDADGDGVADLRLKFPRAEIARLLQIGPTELTLTGNLSGQCLQGRDTLRVVQERGQGRTGVDEAMQPAFALLGVTPNPVVDALRVDFSLPDGGRAVLALYDVAGRQLTVREIGGLGPGRHAITLARAGLGPGVYVVQLTRGGRCLTTRVILLR